MKQCITSPRVLAALGVILVVGAFMIPTHGMFLAQFEAPVIVHVNLERVFNEIDDLQKAQRALEAKLLDHQSQANKLKTEAERLKADLELLVPGTDKYGKVEKEWKRVVLDYQALIAFADGKRDSMLADARRMLYGEIVSAAGSFAQANGIDYILTDDSQLQIHEGSDVQVVQQLALRRIMYAERGRDVTDQLIAWIDTH